MSIYSNNDSGGVTFSTIGVGVHPAMIGLDHWFNAGLQMQGCRLVNSYYD